MGLHESDTVALKVSGMDCQNCALGIERALNKKGIDEVFVNFQTGEVRYHRAPTQPTSDEVETEIAKLGYTVVATGDEVEETDAINQLKRATNYRLIICAALTLPLLLAHPLKALGVDWTWLHSPWWQVALAFPVYVIGGLHFGRSAWGGLRAGYLNMDVLIWLGATAAMVYSFIGLYLQNPNYYFFETAAGILTLVLVGKWLETRAVARTTDAIGSLLELREEFALRISSSGALIKTPTKDLIPGDLIQVNTGDRVPADGLIAKGMASVDESLLTGESLPIEKGIDGELIGGSLLLSGSVQLRVSRTGQDSTLAQMVELVKTAQQDKPHTQRLADRVSAVFVPVVIAISLLTFIVSWMTGYASAPQAALNAIAVLLISCPCAMGLATPTAVMVGVGRLAKRGILVKGGQTVETLAEVDHMVFDKTGTLTQGKIEIDRIDYFAEDQAPVAAILYAMEAESSHPIALAIRHHLESTIDRTDLPALETMEMPGEGLIGFDADTGDSYKLGSARLLKEETTETDASVFLLRNDQLIAAIHLIDPAKEESADTLKALGKRNIQVSLLSGDSPSRTQALAEELAISDWTGGQLPNEKLSYLEAVAKTSTVAMIGDGINDAAALSRADVGISFGGASGVAVDAAKVVLLGDRLTSLVEAVDLSRLTLRTIKESLFWAFSYNVIAIPLAALGYLNPLWAAAFMAFSDLVVIGNAVRLRKRRV
ncbi:MAG: cation-translocating P-type ATPase [Bacteroidota bacterium]